MRVKDFEEIINEDEKKYQEIIKYLENQEYAQAIIREKEIIGYKDIESIIEEKMKKEETKESCKELLRNKKYGEALIILHTINKYRDVQELIKKAEKKNKKLYKIKDTKLAK